MIRFCINLLQLLPGCTHYSLFNLPLIPFPHCLPVQYTKKKEVFVWQVLTHTASNKETSVREIHTHIFMKDMHIYFTHSCTAAKYWQCTHSNILHIGQHADVDWYIWKNLTSCNRTGFVSQEQQDDERWLPNTKVHFATKLQSQSRISVIMRQLRRYL